VRMILRPVACGYKMRPGGGGSSKLEEYAMETLKLDSPEIGIWYRGKNGEIFSVVAMESNRADSTGTIEIQYFDGAVEEVDRMDWAVMLPRVIPEPEDCSGALDMHVDADPDAGVDEPDDGTWVDPLSVVDRLQ